jgi:hypothetical protein
MVSRWLGIRQMQERRAEAEAKKEQMGNREQKGNRVKREPKKEKSKEIPSPLSTYVAQFGRSAE